MKIYPGPYKTEKVYINLKEQKFRIPLPIYIGNIYIWPLLKQLKIRRAYLAWKLKKIKYYIIYIFQVSFLERVKLFLFKESRNLDFRKYKGD